MAGKRVRVGALELAYEEAGEGGRPLVLVHGFAGSSDDFADVLAPLGELGRTLVPDQRGHGGTTNPGTGYSLDQMTSDLHGFLDAVDVEACDLLGHSLGGMVAIRLALAAPGRVASLVLMDTAASAVAPAPRFMLDLIGSVASRIPPRWLWRLTKLGRGSLPEPMKRAEKEMGEEHYWQRLLTKLEAIDPVAYKDLQNAIFDQKSLVSRLPEIECPTLVMVGAEDTNFHGHSQELAEGIPNAKLLRVEGSHHSPQIEAKDLFLAAMHRHLAAVR